MNIVWRVCKRGYFEYLLEGGQVIKYSDERKKYEMWSSCGNYVLDSGDTPATILNAHGMGSNFGDMIMSMEEWLVEEFS